MNYERKEKFYLGYCKADFLNSIYVIYRIENNRHFNVVLTLIF